MRKIDQLLSEYGESHQNGTNKLIHWICVPAIFFSIVGLIMCIPWPFGPRTYSFNWATVVAVLAVIYYMRLSLVMTACFIVILQLTIWGNYSIAQYLGSFGALAQFSLALFFVAWIGQFIGHKIEGKKPSFFKDLQFLLIGPAWLMHFVLNKLSIRY